MNVGRKLFLAGPFKGLLNPNTGTMTDDEKQKFLKLIAFFESKGFLVHNAHQREAWGKALMTPEQCTEIDFNEIASCDYFVGLPGHPPSPGTHIEIGWASALKKPIILLLEAGKEYGFLIQGLYTVANVTYITYHSEADYLKGLEAIFS